jgi:putative hydrolase of the HAD superfamily
VLPCLELLKRKGIKTGIITDGYISTQRNKLKVLNADKYFDHIIATGELGREYWKPHPKAYEMMQKMLQVSFDEMIYIGDNPEKDFYIGSIYPIKTVMICRKNNDSRNGIYKDRLYLENIKESYKILSLVELIALCDK